MTLPSGPLLDTPARFRFLQKLPHGSWHAETVICLQDVIQGNAQGLRRLLAPVKLALVTCR